MVCLARDFRRYQTVMDDVSLYSQYARVCRCLCVCVCVCACVCVLALTIISTDKILRFINTFIIIMCDR